MIGVSFMSNREQLEALLPEGFEVAGDTVTVVASYIKEIPWLAGRGYNTLGIIFPATFHGQRDRVTGDFLTVLWENMADPIISGREELGFAKLYCELPEPTVFMGETQCTASWLGFKFMDMRVSNLKPPTEEEAAALSGREGTGLLHYKYIPRTGEWGKADAAYAVLTPAADPYRKVAAAWVGEGSVKFYKATWEEMPTMCNVVNTFHVLEIKSFLGAVMVTSVGSKDLGDQRILT